MSLGTAHLVPERTLPGATQMGTRRPPLRGSGADRSGVPASPLRTASSTPHVSLGVQKAEASDLGSWWFVKHQRVPALETAPGRGRRGKGIRRKWSADIARSVGRGALLVSCLSAFSHVSLLISQTFRLGVRVCPGPLSPAPSFLDKPTKKNMLQVCGI